MKKCILLFLLLMVTATSFAQNRLISGEITDRDTKEPMMQTTVQLLKMDSTYVAGAVSNEDGLFRITAPANGKYLLKITSVGYTTSIKRIEIAQDKDLAMGKIAMGSDAIMLKGATVTGMAAKVVLKEDTFVYNSAAYRTPEGSVIEELVRRLPGAEIDDEGNVKINGKEVKKIKENGKEFMIGDTKTALKNLPTSAVEQIKAYNEKSDLAKVSGIDDGEENMVLDFGMKKGMNKGTFGNVDLGIGTKDRYALRGMGMHFTDNSRFFLMGSGNNVNDMGFGGGRGGRFGGGRNGLNASKMVATNYNYEIRDKFQIDLSARWNHNSSDAWSKSSSESFISDNTVKSFSNRLGQNFGSNDNFNFNMRLEWKPDTMTNIMFRPSASLSTSNSRGINTNATFNDDPYKTVADPLDDASQLLLAQDSIVVNTQHSNSISHNDSKSVNGMLQINCKLNDKGRNITVQVNGNYSKQDAKSLSATATHQWLKRTASGLDSTYQTNRYNLTPTTNRGYRLQATYSEPIFRAAYLQLRYSLQYSNRKSDRTTYDFSEYADFPYMTPVYNGWDNYLGHLTNPLDSYESERLSRHSEYDNYVHEINLTFRMIRQKYQLNAGFMVQPQHSNFIQDYLGRHADTVRNVVNFSPTLDFRYNFSKQHRLRVNYRGTTSQPSIDDLLDITDDSNPMNITKGNSGLKPSFTQRLSADYSNYIQNHMRFIFANLSYSTTSNSITNKVSYDATSGARTSRPENINGNWDASGQLMFNTAIDTIGRINVNTNTQVKYNHNVGLVDLSRQAGNTVDYSLSSVKNTVTTTDVTERLGTSYRTDLFEVELNGSLSYTHGRNKLQPNSNLDTWRFNYGADFNMNLPWGMSLSTDIHMNSRRGFSDNSMNTNELIWNAQIGQSLLKGKPLTLTLQFYDLLQRQSNFSRSISASSRSDVEYNAINSYVMLHAIYRLNFFGGKNGGPEMGPGQGRGRGGRPDFSNPRFQGRGRGMGGPMGPPPGRM